MNETVRALRSAGALSSEAAASLITALTRAAAATGNFSADPNQSVASGLPPRSSSRARMILDDSIVEPSDALAMVLEMSISACSTAFGGRSAYFCPVTKAAISPATVMVVPGRSW